MPFEAVKTNIGDDVGGSIDRDLHAYLPSYSFEPGKCFIREDSYFYYWICDFGHFHEVRESSLLHGGISKIFFLENCILENKFHYEGKNDG